MPTRHFYVPVEGREEEACRIKHPIDGEMRPYGAFWTDDVFSFCLVRDKVLIMTDEEDPNPPQDVGPEALVQQRRTHRPRPKMRIMSAPKVPG